ncbi:MAG: TfoX/Sxy family protein [Clostridia bacterium]|nr:TfoX/Sxy family protein [Clostridia bacterium]
MASNKGYLDFILEQLSGLEDITWKAMMGEYILYFRGRIFGGIYDDRFLVKPTKSAMAMMPGAEFLLLQAIGNHESPAFFKLRSLKEKY